MSPISNTVHADTTIMQENINQIKSEIVAMYMALPEDRQKALNARLALLLAKPGA